MTHTLAAPNLWTSARAMLTELFFLLTGTSPEHLQRLKQHERAHVREWLAALEAMVRKILLIEAAALGPPASSPAFFRAVERCRRDAGDRSGPVKRAPTFTLALPIIPEPKHPARIRMLGAATSLAELLRNKARAQRVAALRNAAPRARQANLANRISALALVIANPLSAIRRMARRLRASRQIGFDIINARVSIPFTFHGDANRAASGGAIAAMTQPNSS